MQKCKNCSHVYAYHCAQPSYTTQHRAVLIIFPLILQTSIRAQMLSTGGKGEWVKGHSVLKLLFRQTHWTNFSLPGPLNGMVKNINGQDTLGLYYLKSVFLEAEE